MEEILTSAVDGGVTHFDLANNYSRSVAGSAERNLGKIFPLHPIWNLPKKKGRN